MKLIKMDLMRPLGGGVISESDAILEVLKKEYDNYSNMIFNESFSLDDKEKAIIEAKYEVIQEAVTAAIIVAIIAVVGAIIALLVAISKLMSTGSSKIVEKAKEVKQNMDAKKVQKSSTALAVMTQDKKDEIISKSIGGALAIISGDSSSTEIEVKGGLVKSGSRSSNTNSSNSDVPMIQGLSFTDFTSYINVNCVKELNDLCDKVWGNIDKGEVSNYIRNFDTLLDETNNQDKLNKRIFSGLNPAEGSDMINLLIEVYNKDVRPFTYIIDNPVQTSNEITKLSGKAKTAITTMERQLKVLDTNLKNLQKDFGDRVKARAANESTIVFESSEDDFINKMIEFAKKVVKGSVDKIKDFLAAWQKVEKGRLNAIGRILGRFNSYLIGGNKQIEQND